MNEMKQDMVYGLRSKILVLLLDLSVFVVALTTIYSMRFDYLWSYSLEQVTGSFGVGFIGLVLLAMLYVFGSYEIERVEKFSILARRHLIAYVLVFVAAVIVNFIMAKDRSGIFGRGVLFGSLGLAAIISLMYRGYFYHVLSQIKDSLNWLVVLSNDLVTDFLPDLVKNGFHGKVSLVTEQALNSPSIDNVVNRGTFVDLPALLKKNWTGVVVGTSNESQLEPISASLMVARFSGQKVMDLNSFYEVKWQKLPAYFLNQAWLVFSDGFSLSRNPVGLRVKRLVDLGLSGLLLFVAWPVMLLAALAIKLESPGDVFYRQTRTGKGNENFVIFKFRSMRSDAEKNGAQWAQKNDARITRVGQFIRLTRIDELPQLINVFKGEMSFIGPRPERPEFNELLEKQIPFYRLRHLVNPGITGWAQVMYPYGASVEDSKEKLQYDLYYIKNYSLLLDFQIVLKTISVVLLGKGR